jgi:hypothetical protein
MIHYNSFMMKALTEQELLLCAAFARGANEQELMDLSGKSRTTIQRLKRRQEFLDKADEIRQGVASKVTETAILKGTETVAEYLDKVSESSSLLYEISLVFLDKCQKKLEQLDIDEIAPSRLPSSIKSVSDVMNMALTLNRALPEVKNSLELADIEAAKALLIKKGYLIASPDQGDLFLALNQLVTTGLLPVSVVENMLKALKESDTFRLKKLAEVFK